jgi:uncharacterized protein
MTNSLWRNPRVLLITGASVLTLAWAFTLLAPFTTATAQGGQQPPPSINVSGEGEVRADPDLAVVTVGVTAVQPTSQGAMNDVNGRLAAVVGAVRALGVESRDIQTSGLSLQPVYRPRGPRDDAPPEIEAYRASNNVTITVRNLDRAGPVLDAANANGANVFGGVSFGLSNVEELRMQALALATANASAKAQAIANGAGVRIVGVLQLSEEGVSVPRPAAQADVGRAALAAAPPSPPTVVEAGEMVVRARVRAQYAF